jgi:two-component system probable response regulator PhcQ
MNPGKILYVDDEAMALKYFERLVSPLAPVLTGLSVAEGKVLLDQHAGEIAVLVSDQRMPGASGNELLRYARENHPLVVRLLTTAYSELGEAIEAINSGEIYRYITKPWDLENLRTDLKNALELASLRGERDSLLREKMAIMQHQLMAGRVSQLAVVCASSTVGDGTESLYTYLNGAADAACQAPAMNWQAMDYSDLMQAEALRGIAIGRQLATWHAEFGTDKSPAAALAALVMALPEQARLDGSQVTIDQPKVLYGVLVGAATELPSAQATAWLAWLIWFAGPVQLTKQEGGWLLTLDGGSPPQALSKDWLAACIENLALQAGVDN